MSGIQQGGDHQVKEAVYAIIARLSSLACAKRWKKQPNSAIIKALNFKFFRGNYGTI
jgi:hypothetical protein